MCHAQSSLPHFLAHGNQYIEYYYASNRRVLLLKMHCAQSLLFLPCTFLYTCTLLQQAHFCISTYLQRERLCITKHFSGTVPLHLYLSPTSELLVYLSLHWFTRFYWFTWFTLVHHSLPYWFTHSFQLIAQKLPQFMFTLVHLSLPDWFTHSFQLTVQKCFSVVCLVYLVYQ